MSKHDAKRDQRKTGPNSNAKEGSGPAFERRSHIPG